MDTCFQGFLWYLPGSELPDHTVTSCSAFWGIAKQFAEVAAPFYSLTSSVGGFRFRPILGQHFLLGILFIPVILVGARWCLTVVLISTFLLTGEAKHLFMCSLVILCVSWRTIYSDPWPILQLGCLSFHCGVVRVRFFFFVCFKHVSPCE